MLLIRQEQIEIMESALVDRFVDRVICFIRTECDLSRPIDGSTLPETDPELKPIIRDLIVHARRYGLQTELGYVLFIILGLGYHREFYKMGVLEKILLNKAESPLNNIKIALREVIFYGVEGT